MMVSTPSKMLTAALGKEASNLVANLCPILSCVHQTYRATIAANSHAQGDTRNFGPAWLNLAACWFPLPRLMTKTQEGDGPKRPHQSPALRHAGGFG